MRSLRVDIGAGTRCDLYYRTDYRGLSTGKDAFMRASLPDLAAARGDSPAKRDALRFIMYHRLGTDTCDPATVLKDAVRSGTLIAVVEQQRRSSWADSRGGNEPKPRSITFSPSQLFGGGARMAGSIGASAPAWPRLPAEDGIAIWFANPGDVLPDGTIATPVATPLADAQPFEYTPDILGGDTEEIAARGVRMTGNEPGGYRINPNGLDVDYFDSNGNLCAQYHESHGKAHGHNFDAGMRDDVHLPMSPINCR